MYAATLSNWMQATATPLTALALAWLHPMRVSRYMFGTSFHPMMSWVKAAASAIRENRHAVADDSLFKKQELAAFDRVRDGLTAFRKTRDRTLEQMFNRVYGSSGLVRSALPAADLRGKSADAQTVRGLGVSDGRDCLHRARPD